jgi:hypothetical protein
LIEPRNLILSVSIANIGVNGVLRVRITTITARMFGHLSIAIREIIGIDVSSLNG